MEWISSTFSSLFSLRGLSRMFFPAPGRNMEVTHPVTCSVELEKIVDTSSLQRGDTVTVGGEADLCRHVGIYLGNDTIIDFTNQLRRTTLTGFIDGAQPVSRVRYTSPWKTDEPEEIVKRAMVALKNPKGVGSYDVISNNSEHFVTYCTFGKYLSYEGIKANKMEKKTKPIHCPCNIL